MEDDDDNERKYSVNNKSAGGDNIGNDSMPRDYTAGSSRSTSSSTRNRRYKNAYMLKFCEIRLCNDL